MREKHGEHMLRELVKRWDNHKLMVRWLSRFFNYLDRYYISRYALAPLKDVGMLGFRDLVYVELKGAIKDGMLAMVDRERGGEQIDRPLLKNVLGLFVEMGMGSMEAYETDFEAHALTNCAQFYAQQSAAWIAVDTCPEYMVKAEECLRCEKERVDAYLHASSELKLLREAERELLSQHEMQLLEKEHSGAAALMRDDRHDDMARMFRLFSRVKDGLAPVAAAFKKHVEAEGVTLVKTVEESLAARASARGEEGGMTEQSFIRAIIELHDKHVGTVVECFSSHGAFHKALKDAFEVFCNKNVSCGDSSSTTFAELLANFCDNLLKKGSSEKLSDEAIEETVDKVVKLLAYVSDKDLFAEFCRKRLSKRLLMDRSASDDAERSLLTKLKQQCGAQFTSRMEGMVTDLQLAKDTQTNFVGWVSERHLPAGASNRSVDLTVTVLTTGFWPTYKFVELNLPLEMVAGVELFKAFYDHRSSNRKLTWMYTLGTAMLNGRFAAKPIELQVSVFQAVALLLFNDCQGELSFNEIKEQMNLPEEDVMRTLHSISCAKYKLLKKSPDNKQVDKSDRFSFNEAFTDKGRRIRVPLPPMDEKKKVTEDVDKDRKYAIDAAIVRVMKSRKVVAHNNLVTDVTQQLSAMFKADLKLIKKRIEELIAREYLKCALPKSASANLLTPLTLHRQARRGKPEHIPLHCVGRFRQTRAMRREIR